MKNKLPAHLFPPPRSATVLFQIRHLGIIKGRVWVRPEEGVTVGADVYMRHTRGDDPTHTAGGVRTDSDTGRADRIVRGRWVIDTNAEGLAQLEVDF